MDTRCEYYKVTDGRIHALRWDGQRNACEATDQWECGACGSKHTARLGTPMHRLKTASDDVKLAVHLAMKGMNIARASARSWNTANKPSPAGWNGPAFTATGYMISGSGTWS